MPRYVSDTPRSDALQDDKRLLLSGFGVLMPDMTIAQQAAA